MTRPTVLETAIANVGVDVNADAEIERQREIIARADAELAQLDERHKLRADALASQINCARSTIEWAERFRDKRNG